MAATTYDLAFAGSATPARRYASVAVRRRRASVVAAVAVAWLVMAVAIVTLLGASAAPTAAAAGTTTAVPAPAAVVERSFVVVRPGDTVWTLMRAHVPAGTNFAQYVAQVVAFNQLDAGALRPGDVVWIPLGAATGGTTSTAGTQAE